MSKLPKGWFYLVVGEKLYIVDETADKMYLVDGNKMFEVEL